MIQDHLQHAVQLTGALDADGTQAHVEAEPYRIVDQEDYLLCGIWRLVQLKLVQEDVSIDSFDQDENCQVGPRENLDISLSLFLLV